MTDTQRRDSLDELLNSSGWEVLKEEMKNSILQAAFQISDNANMPVDEINFRRGTIWAARKFVELPSSIHQLLSNDILMDAANRGELKMDERYGPNP
tara:strand:- start:212 stop:502 length:291 start_codon:yes stop_codon:yes gene_type:complete